MSAEIRKIRAVIVADDGHVAGMLAGEALRRAAGERGRTIEVEIRHRDDEFLCDAFASEPGEVLLIVASSEIAHSPFPGRPRTVVPIADVLLDAGATIDRIAQFAPRPSRRIVAVTSCPTGIAHTFMAAEGLQQSAAAQGISIRVETQGSVGARDELTADEIRDAEIVLIAADREVDRTRFAGKRVYATGTKSAINDGKALIITALADAELQPGATLKSQVAKSGRAGPYKHLMNGVSFMLPFVVAGGLLMAVAFALGGIYADREVGTLAHALFTIGAAGAFPLIVAALAGHIASSIADRPGLAPGFVGGMLATSLGAGFLGGIAAGFIAGYGTDFLNRCIRLPRNLDGLKPMLILPVLGTLLTGLLMIYVVGTPVAQLLSFLTDWLGGMQGSSAILFGLLLGSMMAFDMGGPVNKAAYAFSTGLMASQVFTPMAAAMVAGMTPPIALSLATRLFPSRFTDDERKAGDAAAVLGLAFISEGAIPFAARDPLRVIPALMAGSGTAGAISMAIGAELKVPHGGIFVLPIPGAVTHLLGYVFALVAGTIVGALAVGLLKRPNRAEAFTGVAQGSEDPALGEASAVGTE